ncbi:hypothetical protein [Stenotrophomonas maltophilia]|nr:hypothetical protein [uncultured Stenotrophomonas sp.]
MPALLHRHPQDVATVTRLRAADRATFPEFPVHALLTRYRVRSGVAVVIC